MKVMMGDILIDLDYALSQVGVSHREMEMADAYYMINKYMEAQKEAAK